MSFAVMAESKTGQVHKLRGGFRTREAAEDHPVRMAEWKNVWVTPEQESEPRIVDDDGLPPLPWNWETSGAVSNNGQFHIYITDATGRKIAAIWGKGNEKVLVANRILDAVNGAALLKTGK